MKQTDKVKEQLQERINELDGNWKRALADYKNSESRAEKTVRDAVIYGNRRLMAELLKVSDDLDLAVEHHPDEAWIKLIRDDLRNILVAEGLTEIETRGKIFDPNLMECVAKVAGEENLVVKVVQTGYKLHDRILRPAKVEVGETKNKKQETRNNEN